MRILVNDYAGHPFQAQLSRELARRGHAVLHLHAAFFQTPKGRLARGDGDAPGFAVEGLSLGEPFAKYRFFKRRGQELAYGTLVAERAARFAPDLVLCANTPLDPLQRFQADCARRGVPFIFWLQDIYGVGIDRLLRLQLGPLGAMIGAHYRKLEQRVARASQAIVTISEDFRPVLEGWGVPKGRIEVIENWAPLEELPALPRSNAWSREHGLEGRIVLLYSGTLGLKHDPALLSGLAEQFAPDPKVAVVVASEGPAVEWLAAKKREAGLANLELVGFQPYERFPELLASGDVLLVQREQAGIVVEPGDRIAFAAAAQRLVGQPALRAALGKNGLDYARRTFDIHAIAERFEEVMVRVIHKGAASHASG
jgi:colanic acid biosynthesis glycosyl transferase WcaI